MTSKAALWRWIGSLVYIAGPCNRAAGQAPDDEGDGRVGGGAAGQAPSGGRWTGNRRESKKLEKTNMFWNILSANVVFFTCFS